MKARTKITTIILVIFISVVATESIGQRQAVNNELITVDVRKTYSQKKELILQDFMDVEYIALETNNNFLNQGVVLDIGKKFIIVKNKVNDGNIFIYDRNGKAIRKINRNGQGPEEYINIYGITLDEENEEMLVNDIMKRRIIIYDFYGKFKRSFEHKGSDSYYDDIFNYDKYNLICYNILDKEIPFLIISKHDGSIIKEIKVPFKNKTNLMQSTKEGERYLVVTAGHYRSIAPYKGNWILTEVSSDTLYSFSQNYGLHPFIIRTPPIQSMNPEVMIVLRLISDRYYFMETIKNEFDFNNRTGFPKTFFAYDRQAKSFSGYTLLNGDYSNKKEIYLNMLKPVNHEIESWQPIEAYQLVESYKKGELKDGKLKEIASKLDPEDNPVIMLIKHKKN